MVQAVIKNCILMAFNFHIKKNKKLSLWGISKVFLWINWTAHIFVTTFPANIWFVFHHFFLASFLSHDIHMRNVISDSLKVENFSQLFLQWKFSFLLNWGNEQQITRSIFSCCKFFCLVVDFSYCFPSDSSLLGDKIFQLSYWQWCKAFAIRGRINSLNHFREMRNFYGIVRVFEASFYAFKTCSNSHKCLLKFFPLTNFFATLLSFNFNFFFTLKIFISKYSE